MRLVALALAASSLSVSCFLNPKTDDLPGSPVFGDGVPAPDDNSVDNPPTLGGIDADDDEGESPRPGDDDDDLLPPGQNPADEPDAGELADTFGAAAVDAGDAGVDAGGDSPP